MAYRCQQSYYLSIQQEKPLFFFFTGSDWCGWCIRLQKAVFSKPEFKSWAKENVVLLELDFNRAFQKKISAAQQGKARLTQNENMIIDLSRKLGVRGYPTVWFVTPEIIGKEVNIVNKRLGSLGASPLEVKGWLAGANQILKKK